LPKTPYTKSEQLKHEQVFFISLCHHFLFLATLESMSGAPAFSDTLVDKFNFLQSALKNNELSAFGVKVESGSELDTWWKGLQSSLGDTNRERTISQVVEYITKGPKAVYNYIRVKSEPMPNDATVRTHLSETTEEGMANLPVPEGTVSKPGNDSFLLFIIV
jgi:hypothetical protein